MLFQLLLLCSTISLTVASNATFSLLGRRSDACAVLPIAATEFNGNIACGLGSILPSCTCCEDGSIGCLTAISTCVVGNGGVYECQCDSGYDCSDCEPQGLIECGNSCCPGSGYVCCQDSDGTDMCCPDENAAGSSAVASTAAAPSTTAAATTASPAAVTTATPAAVTAAPPAAATTAPPAAVATTSAGTIGQLPAPTSPPSDGAAVSESTANVLGGSSDASLVKVANYVLAFVAISAALAVVF